MTMAAPKGLDLCTGFDEFMSQVETRKPLAPVTKIVFFFLRATALILEAENRFKLHE